MKEKDIICLELMANIRREKRKCSTETRHTIASRLWRMCFMPIIVVRKPTRNFRRELHCNLQIISESELPDNLKALYFKILFHIKTVPKIA